MTFNKNINLPSVEKKKMPKNVNIWLIFSLKVCSTFCELKTEVTKKVLINTFFLFIIGTYHSADLQLWLKGGFLMSRIAWVAKMAAKIAKIFWKLSNIPFFQFLISYFGPAGGDAEEDTTAAD